MARGGIGEVRLVGWDGWGGGLLGWWCGVVGGGGGGRMLKGGEGERGWI